MTSGSSLRLAGSYRAPQPLKDETGIPPPERSGIANPATHRDNPTIPTLRKLQISQNKLNFSGR